VAFPRKNSRSITVNGRRFRWQGWLGERPNPRAEVHVALWDRPGQRLLARFDPWVVFGEETADVRYLSKRYVRVAILEGLTRGWQPEARGGQVQIEEAELCGDGRERPLRGSSVPIAERLLAPVIAEPEAIEPRLVLADTLQERGHLRGEMIALSCQQASGGLAATGAERLRALLTRFWRPWTAPLRRVGLRRWGFSRGFCEQLRCAWHTPPRAPWEALHRVEPISTLELVGPQPEALSWLLQPTTRVLRLRGNSDDATLNALLGSPHLPTLRELDLRESSVTVRGIEALLRSTRLELTRLRVSLVLPRELEQAIAARG
jgi:uncharacterized protein (TIGR02996 family)